MGVAGAAYGTLLANVIGAIAILAVQARDGFDFHDVRRHHLGGVWRLGIWAGIQFVLGDLDAPTSSLPQPPPR